MLLWELFTTFFMIGLVSFGGGYAMIPLIEYEVISHSWMDAAHFTDVIAIAGMSPGPIATNSAIFVGYNTAGAAGAAVAAVGMVLPSLLIVILVAMFFYKIRENILVKSALYGLRPMITGLIIYAAISFAIKNEIIGPLSWQSVSMMGLFAISLFALVKWKVHPVFVILLSGIIGAVIYV